MSRIACVAIVKNEERHIAEWIAYQFVCGFDTVILFDNHSTDQTKDKAIEVARHRDVRVLGWHMFSSDYQLRAYEYAARIFGNEFKWMAFFDSDEFLVLDEGLDLHAVLDARQDAAAIAIPWAIFGSSGHREQPEGLMIENFLHRSETSFSPNRHVKSIICPRKMLSCLNPHAFNVRGNYVDLMGAEIAWESYGILNQAPKYTIGKLHHYFTRSWQDWIHKLNRGYHDIKRSEADFEIYDRNDVLDASAARLARAILSVLSGSCLNMTEDQVFYFSESFPTGLVKDVPNQLQTDSSNIYFSCAPNQIYRKGGIYEDIDLKKNNKIENFNKGKFEVVSEIYEPSSYTRRMPENISVDNIDFKIKLTELYKNINNNNKNMAASALGKFSSILLVNNVIYTDPVRCSGVVYETFRPNDRPNTSILSKTELSSINRLEVNDEENIYLYIGSVGSFNYGHWLVDDLPRVKGFCNLRKLYSNKKFFLVLTSYSSTINEVRYQSLKAVLKTENSVYVLMIQPNYLYYFKELYYVTPVSYHPMIKSSEALNFIRDLVIEQDIEGHDTIFVVRRNERGRQLVNLNYICSKLEERGFKTIDVEGMSFEEQVRIFSRASVVVGCMGAAMANTVFCSPGTNIIYLAPEGWVEPFYWDIAAVLDHFYHVCYGAVTDASVPAHFSPYTILWPSVADVLGKIKVDVTMEI